MKKPREQRASLPLYMHGLNAKTITSHPGCHTQTSRIAQLFACSHGHWFQQQSTSVLAQNLAQLLTHYLQYLPSLLSDFLEQLETHRWHCVSHCSQSIISEYFQRESSEEMVFLNALSNAYFCHRLIEEIHDQLMSQTGYACTTWNMSTVNVVVHHVIGHVFAEKLDQVVIELSLQLVRRAPTLGPPIKKQGQTIVWPCFCEYHGLTLSSELPIIHQ